MEDVKYTEEEIQKALRECCKKNESKNLSEEELSRPENLGKYILGFISENVDFSKNNTTKKEGK